MEGNSSLLASSQLTVQYIEDALEFLPGNPLTYSFEAGWTWMTDNYTKFQITTLGSLIVHEVYYQVMNNYCINIVNIECGTYIQLLFMVIIYF